MSRDAPETSLDAFRADLDHVANQKPDDLARCAPDIVTSWR
jgi:hypothetical protein